MAAFRLSPATRRPRQGVLVLVAALAVVGLSTEPAGASDFAMATGESLQWTPDGAGHFRPMELDPRDPTGNPWLFGEQFREPESTRLPWARYPSTSQSVSERFEPRPWGEQGRRDRYRDDGERERLRNLSTPTPTPARRGDGGLETRQRQFDLTPRPATLTRPLSAGADYAVKPAPDTRDTAGWGYDARPW